MTSTPLVQQTQFLLDELEQTLKACDLWSQQVPDAAALNSAAPFCCDTLRFEQWLQFIFIPRMANIIETGQALPGSMTLLPMAEQSWLHHPKTRPAQRVLARFDALWERT